MKLHVLSDLHTEFDHFKVPDVGADITVLAGDISTRAGAVQWARENVAGRAIVVAGNHDFYGMRHETGLARMRADAQASGGQVILLEQEAVVIDGVQFLGATGWTDFSGCTKEGIAPELAMSEAQRCMRDYELIGTASGQALTPEDVRAFAQQSKAWIVKVLAKGFVGPRVLVTHHPISRMGDNPRFPASPLTPSFVNDWSEIIDGQQLDLVIHGHTHANLNVLCGKTRVLSNQRGYPGELGRAFNPELVVEP